MGKVFSYVRFSSARQASGNSYERQIKAAKAFCDENGLELADAKEYLFFDAGRSAYKGKHLDDTGELARFLGFVEDGTIPAGSYLVIESLDRLSREKVRDALPRFLDLLAKGINVYTSTDKRLYTQDYNELDLIVSIVSMSRAHEESATKGKRVSSAWRNKHKEARETGKVLGKLRPLWLDVVGNQYVVIPEHVAVVQKIFNLSTKGYGSRSIAAMLNQEGVPSFTAGRKNVSGLWGFSTMRHILDSRSVLGEYQPHIFIEGKRTPDGEPIKEYFPAVITEEQYYLAQAARASRREHKVTNTSTNFNVLAGILHCYKCEGVMHLQGMRGRKYYKCCNTQRGMCDAGVIGAPRSELVFKEILAKVDSLSLVQDSSGSLNRQIQIIEGKLEELKNKQTEAEESHTEFPSRVTARILQSLEIDIESLETEQGNLRQQLAADKVISKEDFFKKLDLTSYEGRAAANNLMKRLGIYIFALKGGRMNEIYLIVNEKKKPNILTNEIEYVMFTVYHSGTIISISGVQDNYIDLQVAQGEIAENMAQVMKREAWDELPPDALKMLQDIEERVRLKLA